MAITSASGLRVTQYPDKSQGGAERTPGAAAVSLYRAGGQGYPPDHPWPCAVSALAAGQTLGAAGGEAPAVPSLVSEHETVTDTPLPFGDYQARRAARARRRRCFHRVMSGLERGGDLRVVMLSTGVRDKVVVQRAFRSLVAWAKRRGLLEDYIRVPELTADDYIHLHLIFRGRFIDRPLLMRKWYALLGGPEYMPGAKYVYLQRLRSKVGIAHYLAKYMAKGDETWVRGNYSWSWGWVWRGFCGDWEALKRAWAFGNERGFGVSYAGLLALWRWHCRAGISPS